jgi:hypothetical protein
MLALCCFECFFCFDFPALFLCQCVKKPSLLDGFFICEQKSFYFHFTAWTSGFFALLSSVAGQAQFPPHPPAIDGFNHVAKRVQPRASHSADKDMKTETDVLGNTFLNTTTALQITRAATIRISIISISSPIYAD